MVETCHALPPALSLSIASIALLAGLRFWRPRWPAMLIVVALAAPATVALRLPVETTGLLHSGRHCATCRYWRCRGSDLQQP